MYGLTDPGRIEPFRGYGMLPTAYKFFTSDAKYRLWSSGYGTGKSTAGCRESIRHAVMYPHSRHLIGRHTYRDLEDTTMVTFWREMDRIGLSDGKRAGMRHYIFTKADQTLTWWNGTQTMFRHMEDMTESRFGSFEVNTIFLDEGSEVHSEVYRKLLPSRLRWHLPGCNLWNEILSGNVDAATVACGCPRRAWICTNPGPCDYLMEVVQEEHDEQGDWLVLHAPPGENIFNGQDYWDDLIKLGKKNGPVWFNRFVQGRWDAFEGQRFTMLDEGAHLLPETLQTMAFPHTEFDIYEGHDFGWANPHASIWLAIHKDGELPPIVFAEYEREQRELPDIAGDVKLIRHAYGYPESGRAAMHAIQAYGDPAGNNKRPTGVTDIGLLATYGIDITPAKWAADPQSRADLIALCLNRVKKTRYGDMRGLMIHPRCKRLIYELRMYRYARRRGRVGDEEDPREKFVKKDDHLIDALGYALGSAPDPLEREKSPKVNPVWEAMMRRSRVPTPAELDDEEYRRP